MPSTALPVPDCTSRDLSVISTFLLTLGNEAMGRQRAVFLDRDGTINIDSGYVCSPKLVNLIPGVWEGIAQLKKAEFLVFVVSNQSAVGRGIASHADVAATNKEIVRQLAERNKQAVIDEFYCCPHHPEEHCTCRKPLAGLADLVRKSWDFIPEESWVVGDKIRDIEFGQNIGIPPRQRILVLTGAGADELAQMKVAGDSEKKCVIRNNLMDACSYIVGTNSEVTRE